VNILSLAPLTVLPASHLVQIDAAHAAGFDAVGLRLQPGMPTDVDVMGNATLLRDIERRLDATGLKVLDIEVFRVAPRTDIRSMLPAMEFASRLGAKYMLCTSVLVAEHLASEEPRTVERFAELCEAGARLGIKPMLEFMIYRSIGTIEDALRMVKLVKHPNMGICVDALHLSRSGGTPDSLRKVDPGLLCYAQICDAPAALPPASQIPVEARFHRLYPGEGSLPLLDLLDALPPGVPLSLEAPDSHSAHLSTLQRAQAVARRTRTLLQALEGRGRNELRDSA
jgi:sugar phosphate isomerase/epimerase